MTSLFYVMFTCPKTRTQTRLLEPKERQSMTRAQFQNWLDSSPRPRHVNCTACGQTHLLVAEEYFLEGDEPPPRGA